MAKEHFPIESGEFINDPGGKGQMGCVIRSDNVDITKEAKELLRNAPREGGSFSTVMLTVHDESIQERDGRSSLGLMGFHKHLLIGEDLMLGRDCDTSALDDMNEVEMEIPEDFKTMLDMHLDREPQEA